VIEAWVGLCQNYCLLLLLPLHRTLRRPHFPHLRHTLHLRLHHNHRIHLQLDHNPLQLQRPLPLLHLHRYRLHNDPRHLLPLLRRCLRPHLKKVQIQNINF